MRLQFAVFAALLVALALVHSAPTITPDEIAAKSSQGYRLLSIVDGEDPVWKTEDEKLQLMREEVQFVCSLAYRRRPFLEPSYLLFSSM